MFVNKIVLSGSNVKNTKKSQEVAQEKNYKYLRKSAKCRINSVTLKTMYLLESS